MLFKVVLLAVAVATAYADSCGNPAVKPDLRGFKQIIAAMAEKGKIVGGVEAVPHSWPWQIVLTSATGSLSCGGSILNKNWIMTAAHCVSRTSNPDSYRVRVGAHDYRQQTPVSQEPNAKTLRLSRVIVHPGYSSMRNDFALLRLAQPLEFNEHVSPVCLADETHGPTGMKCYVTGWGSVRPNRNMAEALENGEPLPRTERISNVLRQVDVQVTDQEACSRAYPGQISADMICAASPGKDSCQGDSGGPFVCEHDGIWKMVGVVSWGRGCARPQYPGVYARTSTALEWINGYINE